MLPKSVIVCPESLYAAMCVSLIVISRAKDNGFTSVTRSRSCVGRSVSGAGYRAEVKTASTSLAMFGGDAPVISVKKRR